MRFSKPLIVALALVAGVAAQAQPARWHRSAPPDLRSTLKQLPPPAQATYPRRLTAEERAVLRRQLSQPAVSKQRSRPEHPRSWQHW